MQEPNPSAKRPSGWRRAKFAAGTLALTMGALGAGLAATAAPAWANASTNSYVIGSQTGAVSSVTLSPTATSLSYSLTVILQPGSRADLAGKHREGAPVGTVESLLLRQENQQVNGERP